MACDVEVCGGRIAAMTDANKNGLTRVEAGQVVDCTGDADLAAWAGCPVEETEPLMPMTMHFRIGNVKPVLETNPAAKQAFVEARRRGELPEFDGPGLIFAFVRDEAYIHATRVAGDATPGPSSARGRRRCQASRPAAGPAAGEAAFVPENDYPYFGYEPGPGT